MSELNIEDCEEVIASAESSLAQMLALQLKKQLQKCEELQQKLNESERYGRQADITIENLERKVEQLEVKLAESQGIQSKLTALFGDMKEIEGFKYQYFITSKGLVFSTASGAIRQLKPAQRSTGKNEYLFVKFEAEGKLKNMPVHRMVAENFIGEKPHPDHVINHKDGNKKNNAVENLEWTTISENARHAYRIGLSGGRKHGAYKGPIYAENSDGFGYVFFDSKQVIEAGFNLNSIRNAILNPHKKVFGFSFSRSPDYKKQVQETSK